MPRASQEPILKLTPGALKALRVMPESGFITTGRGTDFSNRVMWRLSEMGIVWTPNPFEKRRDMHLCQDNLKACARCSTRIVWAASVTLDQERWAEALMIERLHGNRAFKHVAERLLELASNGDETGWQRWSGIAERLKHLSGDDKVRS